MSDVKVPYVDLAWQHRRLRGELLAAVGRVLDSGRFILGAEVEAFERRLAELCGTRYAVGVGSGTDALILALRCLGIGPGDEVITVPNSFVATASAIVQAGATPVFADVGEDCNINPGLIEGALTERTRAVLPVHLTGRPADMRAIGEVARAHGLRIVEDAAQAIGARYEGRPVGSFGAAAAFSLHPLKNLSAAGDGGAITTDDSRLYEKLLRARSHGLRDRDHCAAWERSSRLDAIQAALLRVKMDHLAEWTEARRGNAAFYRRRLEGCVEVPAERPHEHAVYHTFVIQAERREELRAYLRRRGVETKVHYPIPIHLQEAARPLGYRRGDFPVAERQARRMLSLPVGPELSARQRDHVVRCIAEFHASQRGSDTRCLRSA